MKKADEFSIDLRDAAGTLEISKQLWQRFCEDMMDDQNKAKVRLLSGIQIAIRDARDGGFTEPLMYYRKGT